MKNIELSEDQLANMSYTDVANLVLEQKGAKMTIQDIFLQVIKIMSLPSNYFESKIGDFFGLLSTDKRFIMLDHGYWDLRDNHANKIVIGDDDDDDDIIISDEVDNIPQESDEDNYDADTIDDDPEDDDLKDFAIVDEEMEEM